MTVRYWSPTWGQLGPNSTTWLPAVTVDNVWDLHQANHVPVHKAHQMLTGHRYKPRWWQPTNYLVQGMVQYTTSTQQPQLQYTVQPVKLVVNIYRNSQINLFGAFMHSQLTASYCDHVGLVTVTCMRHKYRPIISCWYQCIIDTSTACNHIWVQWTALSVLCSLSWTQVTNLELTSSLSTAKRPD